MATANNHYDPRVDAYIEKAAPFAQEIIAHVRKLVHEVCPDVQETIKWGMPNFDYAGQILINIAGFKKHCGLNFWKRAAMPDPDNILKNEEALGGLGQLKSLADLPKDAILKKYLKAAMKLNEDGVKAIPKKKTVSTKELVIPSYFTDILNKNKPAKEAFEKLSPSHKREYIEWFEEAKTDTTRNKRMETALEWVVEGKSRNWKYMK